MIRQACFAVLLVACQASWATVSWAGPVDDARLDYIDGNYEKAIQVLLPAALAGDANAQNIVGDAFDRGNGVDRDHAKALEWWTKSADQGFSKAQYNLGRMLSTGREGVPPDYPLAEGYLQKAADQGNGDAFNELGLMFAYGRGRAPDAARAVELYSEGAALGSRISISNLGAAYATGAGVDQDFSKAYDLLSQAAALSDPQAVHNLGVLYRDGLHVQANETVAFLLFTESQRLGYPKAGHQLADMMMTEAGPRYDPVSALGYCLWSELVSSDLEQSELFLDCTEIAAGMTDADRQSAEDFARALADL